MACPPCRTWREHLTISALVVLPRAAECRVGWEWEVEVRCVGDDWAEDHHDVELVDEAGRRLGKARLREGVAGITRLHTLLAAQLDPTPSPARW